LKGNMMVRRGATPEESRNCIKLYRKLNEMMGEYDVDVVMNTLCFIIADMGVELDMNKQVLIANVVEQVSSAYNTCYLGKAEPQGEA